MIRVRKEFEKGSERVALFNAPAQPSGMATPTMNRKKGKTRSVGVQPVHSACPSGQ